MRKEAAASGAFDEDGALHISGIDVIASITRRDWSGASIDAACDGEVEVRRAHVTCPHCASACGASDERCWNCGAAL